MINYLAILSRYTLFDTQVVVAVVVAAAGSTTATATILVIVILNKAVVIHGYDFSSSFSPFLWTR